MAKKIENFKTWEEMTQQERQAELRKHFIISNKQYIEAGLMDEWTPPIEKCEFCGRDVVTLGFWTDYNGVLGDAVYSPILWKGDYKGWNQPIAYATEPCLCADSRAFYKSLEATKESERLKIQEALETEKLNAWKKKLAERSRLHRFLDEYQFDTYKVNSSSQEQAYRISKQYVEAYEEKVKQKTGSSHGKGLFYTGDVGTGKTHLAISTLRGLTDKGISTLAISDTELFNRLRDSYNDRTGMKYSELMNLYLETSVLLIDDLGTTKPSEWTSEQLFHIVDTRVNQRKPIFITSNYWSEDLVDRLAVNSNEITAKAIVSRLENQSVKLKIIAPDFRTRH